MASQVFYSDLRVTPKENIFVKLASLLDRIGLNSKIKKGSLVAIKVHFGERGNTSYISPVLIRQIVNTVKEHGGKPFLTDCSTLYHLGRGDAVSHIITAIENGFDYSVVGAPLIIGDGLNGGSSVKVKINKGMLKEVSIGHDIFHSDSIISVAHFKAHELAGFGGTIKNVGMGCASRVGKLQQHSNVNPVVNTKICVGCGECLSWCAQGAMSIVDKKSRIDPERCVGCGECFLICKEGAIQVKWNETGSVFQKKMVEYTLGVLKGKEKKSIFINFITHVSPACDCYPCSDVPIVPDVGIVISTDPVAIDQASVDLVNQQTGNRNSALKGNFDPGEDKFKGVYPHLDWRTQLEYGEEIGLGTRKYKLVKL
ncbi:MAG: DUF362 domain-containing protein [Thermodesulfobacteriota bacterium]